MSDLKESMEKAVSKKRKRVLDQLDDAEEKVLNAMESLKYLRERIEGGEYVHTTLGRQAPTVAETLNSAGLQVTSLVNRHNVTVEIEETLETCNS